MRLAIFVLVVAIPIAGCTTVRCQHASDPDACAARERAARSEADTREANRRAAHGAARDAREPCRRGDIGACRIVIENDADAAERLLAATTACGHDSASACVVGGEIAASGGDHPRALAMFRKGCDLRDAAGCTGAAALDPEHAFDLDQQACNLGDQPACFRVGRAYLTTAQRNDGIGLITRACKAGVRDACELLGRVEVETR